MDYYYVLLVFIFICTWVIVFAEAFGRHLESSSSAAVSIQQHFSGVNISSFLAQQSVNENVLMSTLAACIPELLSSSILSITITASSSLGTSSSIEVVTALSSNDLLSVSSAKSFAEAIISGQYNSYLQSFASQYGSTSLLNATCDVAVVSYGNQSSSSSSSNAGLVVGLTIFSIFMGSVCCCVGIWYYRKLRAEILEEKRDGQHFNLTTLGQSSSSAKSDGYTRTFSRHSTLQNTEEAGDFQSSVIVENDRNMIWTAPFHDRIENDDDDRTGPIERL